MSLPLPDSLARLLSAPPGPLQDDAWAGFLEEHHPLLLLVARRMGGGHDAAMDRYASILEGLRREEYRRLRGYDGAGPGPFSTWLIVVARRLCLDHHRSRYGRIRAEDGSAEPERASRRRLVDLVGDELDPNLLADPADRSPDRAMARQETLAALGRAIEELEGEDRVLLRMRFEDGVSVPVMARSLGYVSPFVLYRRLDRILKHLRARLAKLGIDDANA